VIDSSKIAILLASVIAGTLGLLVLKFTLPPAGIPPDEH